MGAEGIDVVIYPLPGQLRSAVTGGIYVRSRSYGNRPMADLIPMGIGASPRGG